MDPQPGAELTWSPAATPGGPESLPPRVARELMGAPRIADIIGLTLSAPSEWSGETPPLLQAVGRIHGEGVGLDDLAGLIPRSVARYGPDRVIPIGNYLASLATARGRWDVLFALSEAFERAGAVAPALTLWAGLVDGNRS